MQKQWRLISSWPLAFIRWAVFGGSWVQKDRLIGRSIVWCKTNGCSEDSLDAIIRQEWFIFSYNHFPDNGILCKTYLQPRRRPSLNLLLMYSYVGIVAQSSAHLEGRKFITAADGIQNLNYHIVGWLTLLTNSCNFQSMAGEISSRPRNDIFAQFFGD